MSGGLTFFSFDSPATNRKKGKMIMKRTFGVISACASALAIVVLFSGCRSSCPGDSSGIAEGDQFRITVLSLSSSSPSCAAPSLPVGTSYVVVAGPGEPFGGATCPPIVYGAQTLLPSPPFDPDELTSCRDPGLGGGQLGFMCFGTESSGCGIDVSVVFDESASDGGIDAGGVGSMSVSWTLSACGDPQCDQTYAVRIDRLTKSDAGTLGDGSVDGP